MTQINRDLLINNKIAIFIDSNVDDYQQLIQNLITPASVFILDSSQDGVKQISQILQQNPHFTEAHIVSHGAPGCLYLGNTNLSLDTLDDYISELQSWQAIDTLLLYGCNVAAGDAGAEFIERLYHITEAKIAASAKRTGSSSLGGDWNLEITTGEVDVAIAFNEEVQKRYAGVLATIEVTNLSNNGPGSLRQAITAINGNNDASNTITFADNLSGSTINVPTELLIRNSVTIEGGGITLSGSGNSRVFRIDEDDDNSFSVDSTAVTLRNLTVTNGNSSGIGGGILNEGNLTLEDVTVDGNASTTHGGGIGSFGNLTLRRSTISNNTSGGSGGGFAINAGTLDVENSTISGNTATGTGGGIDTRSNTVTINNSTIADNTAGGSGSGILAGGSNTSVTVTSSIIAQNDGDDDLVTENGATFGGNNNIIGNVDNIDPLLEALGDNGGATQTHALQDGSPAIDAGTGQSTDQRGENASDGDGDGNVQIDIGSFESAPAVLPTIQVAIGDTNPAEGSPAVDGEFIFSFDQFTSDTTINFTIGGTADNPADYTFDEGLSNNINDFIFNADTRVGSFTIAANSGIDATLVVVPVDDTDVEGDETIELTITSGIGYIVASRSDDLNVDDDLATLTIIDDDSPNLPTVSVEATTATATEGGADGVFTISRGDDSTGDLDVTLDISGTAESGDYTLSAGNISNDQLSVTILDGETDVTINLTAEDDTLIEGNETFTLDLASSADYVGTGNATVTIADNDSPAPISTITNNGGTFSLGGLPDGDIVNLQFDLVSSNASFNNTIGVVEVAADGSVGGFAPGSAGYNNAVLEQGRTIFSALSNTANISVDSSRTISESPSGANLLFYLIPDGNPSNGLLFSSDPNQLDIVESGGNFTLRWDDQPTGTGDGDKNDLVVQFSTTTQTAPLGSASQGQADVLDLRDRVGENVTVSYTLQSDAFFDNTVGFYSIDDLTGRIGGVAAGDANYAQEALNNAIGDPFSVDGQTTFSVDGSGLFGIYILQNGQENTPIFSIPDANVGSADHTRLLGDNIFGFEDLLSTDANFDGDFNDLVVSFDFV